MATLTALADLGGKVFGGVGLDVHDGHGGTGVRQGTNDPRPDLTGTSGDQGDLVLEGSHLGVLIGGPVRISAR